MSDGMDGLNKCVEECLVGEKNNHKTVMIMMNDMIASLNKRVTRLERDVEKLDSARNDASAAAQNNKGGAGGPSIA